MLGHINLFPRVESHYVRATSTHHYLYPDLTISKMHSMYQLQNPNRPVSFDLYGKVFRSERLKFHKPMKDQCSACVTLTEEQLQVRR